MTFPVMKRWLRRILVCAGVVVLIAAKASYGQSNLMAPVGVSASYYADSGSVDNDQSTHQVPYKHAVYVEGARWIRLYFGDVVLPAGSRLVLRSTYDDAVQRLDAAGVAVWENTSAYFNGDTVLVELHTAPGTRGNRVHIESVDFATSVEGIAGVDPDLCGVCDGDDRTLSSEMWIGRMMPVGCTASMYTPTGCFVSAGHCVDWHGFGVVQFNVPPSLPDGSVQHPAPTDQYPIRRDSIDFANIQPGRDWAYFECSANTDTGLTPIQAQGDYRPIAEILPGLLPVVVSVTGYGVSEIPEHNSAQQYGAGMLLEEHEYSSGSKGIHQRRAWYFDADATGGNSGSALVRNDEIIGIVTHCTVGCPNVATVIDWFPFEIAREACDELPPSDCDGDLDVDLEDAARLSTCWTGPDGEQTEGSCFCMDPDGSGTVDLRDYADLQRWFTADLCRPATILAGPHTQVVCDNDPVLLEVEVDASEPIEYQWYFNGELIPDAGQPLYLLPSVTMDQVGSYSVRVSNPCGEVESEPAMLSLCSLSLQHEDFESDTGWTVASDPLMTRGKWIRAIPDGTSLGPRAVQPGFDNPYGSGDYCFVTGATGGFADTNDVDGGPTHLISPVMDVTGVDSVTLRYAYWYFRNGDEDGDALDLAISIDGGQAWYPVTTHRLSLSAWRVRGVTLDPWLSDVDSFQIRFSVRDQAPDTILEALIDDVFLLSDD